MIFVGGVVACVIAVVSLGVIYAGKQWKKVRVQKVKDISKTKLKLSKGEKQRKRRK